MIKYFCNRCGKQCKHTDMEDSNIVTLCGVVAGYDNLTRRHVIKKLNMHGEFEHVDFCDECYKEFLEFIGDV